MAKLEDLTGRRFGRLTVIERAPNRGDKVMWRCRCDCGTEKDVYAANLRRGLTVSCGCYNRERARETRLSHGDTKDRLYHVYNGMKARCFQPTKGKFDLYGGRGIGVCDEWLGEHGYEHFRVWALESGYDPTLPWFKCTLDRIDTNGDYSPENCRWVTQKAQCRNKRNNITVTYRGETKTLIEWCDLLGLSYSKVKQRIQRYGYTVEQAFWGR